MSRVTPTTESSRPEESGTAGEVQFVESAEKRRQRLSTGILIGVVGVVLLILLPSTTGVARFALSDAFDEVQLPTVSLPGVMTVLVCALLLLAAAAGFLSGKMAGRVPALAASIAGLSLVVGFLTWAAAGRDLPFPVSNQFAGTLSLATPLVFGALCGVMCERAGVVNVSIEGQFLAAAFAAAVAGSVTQSITIAMIAAVLAGVAMAALLALFSINYLVNQVVLGVVLNLLAVGVTGFLFDQLVQPASAEYNNAPVLESIPIPLLSDIPFFGTVLFDQNILAYLAGFAVLVVWLVVFKTTWGLRIRSVGEHPEAADTVGISVRGIRWSAVLAGGVLAGPGWLLLHPGLDRVVQQGVHRRQRLHRAGRVDHGSLAPRAGGLDGTVLRLRHPDGLPAADAEHPDAEPVPADLAVRRDDHRRRGTGGPGQGAGGGRHPVREELADEHCVGLSRSALRGHGAPRISLVRHVSHRRKACRHETLLHSREAPPVTASPIDWEGLRKIARAITKRAYAPYSKFPVGAAAVVDDGRIIVGCNVENAAYGVTLCAECGLVSALYAGGGGRLVAFTCSNALGERLMPCGRCRQLLWEHGGPSLLIDTPKGIRRMEEMLPLAFGPDDLEHVRKESR